MMTYQDLEKVLERENKEETISYIKSAIRNHEGTDLYETAEIAYEYDARRNRTIMMYQKLLYKISGEVVPDNYSANYKLCSNFFNRFITQQNQFLLGNGVSWNEEDTDEILGDDFDIRLQQLGHAALVGGVAFGFWNMDHLEVFKVTEFVPFYDEVDGSLKAGIRFWQIDSSKPLRAVLYELDGYTNYIYDEEGGRELDPKRAYKLIKGVSPKDGEVIYDGENYPGFPIIPLWANPQRQSELVGMRENIDAYDLIKSGFANDIDDASLIYWTINNAGGMDDVDLVKFTEHMKTIKAAVVEEDGASAEAHTLDVPYNSREAILERLRNDMYDDFMALDTKNIANGATTATQIKAAYEPMNNKADMYEYCIIDFLQNLMEIVGIDDDPSFTRSMIINTQEEISNVIQAATYVSEEYITRKILELLGDGDKADDMLEEMQNEEAEREIGGEEEDYVEEDENEELGEDADIDSEIDSLLAEL